MKQIKYRIFIPHFVQARTDYTTQEFENDNFLTARNSALEYLSEIVLTLMEKKIISISDFQHSESMNLIELGKLNSEFFINDKILNFQKLSECKIKYNYTEKDFKEASKIRVEKKLSLEAAFLSLGVIALEIENEQNCFVPVFEFRNTEANSNRFIEETILSRIIPDFKNSILQTLSSAFYFDLKLKHHEFREIFVTENNLLQKEIITSDSFFDFERKLLSIYNRNCMVSLFVEEKQSSMVRRAILNLQSVYGKLSYDYTPKVLIREQLYSVYFFDFNTERKIIYSKSGNLYFRSHSGMEKANDSTSFEDLLCNEKCKDAFIKDLLEKL